MKELKVGISGVVKKSHEENGITVIDEFIPDGASILAEAPTIFGLPVVVNKDMPAHEVLFGSYPEPERPNMTLDEYAEQCARYFTKIRDVNIPET